MSKGGGSQSQNVTNTPWSGVQPFLTDLFSQAQTQYQNASATGPYMGPQFARPTPASLAGQQFQLGAADAFAGSGAAGDLINLGQKTIQGDFLHPESNPYIGSYIDAALRPVKEEFYENTLPQLSSAAISQGAYGGSRDGVLNGIAAGKFTDTLADTTSNILYNNYLQERQNQMAGGDLLTQGMGLQLLPGQIYQDIGQQQQQVDQQLIDEARYLTTAPTDYNSQLLSQYASLLQPGLGFGQSSSSGGSGGGIIPGAVGGGLTGGLAGYGLAGATGIAGLAPWVGGGALIGGLLGLFD